MAMLTERIDSPIPFKKVNGQFVKTSADLAVDGVADLLKGKM